MRKPIIAGNWKMNLVGGQASALAAAIAQSHQRADSVEVVVCPPSCYLTTVREAIGDAPVGLGAQNMHHASSGAFTGEVSPDMLQDVGCQYVILGHSERRQFFGETDESINRKLRAALEIGLIPIVCVGELLAEREAGRTAEVIEQQFKGTFEGITAEQVRQIVIAYEPVWAIGTGKVATPDQAEEVHLNLRGLLRMKYDDGAADAVRIQYGGSVKPDNAADLLGQPNIDGALVGGASLKSDDFLTIVASC